MRLPRLHVFHTWLLLGLLTLHLSVQGHVGSPHGVFEGQAGLYALRVIVKPPEVVPGLAEIHVRLLSTNRAPERITVLPIHSSVDRAGAPRPDEAQPVPGQPDLFRAELWFMMSGAYGVEVTVEGADGGSFVLPINSRATQMKPMPSWLGLLLIALGSLLVLGMAGIAVAAVRESTLSESESPRGRWTRSIVAGALGLILALACVLGGARWWRAEAKHHQRRIFQPFEANSEIIHQADGTLWKLELTDPRWRHGHFALLPDHGKWVHAFWIEDLDASERESSSGLLSTPRFRSPGDPGTSEWPTSESGLSPQSLGLHSRGDEKMGGPHFVHLHPVRDPDHPNRFQSRLPDLPAGPYWVFLEFTHESGMSQTLVHRITLDQPTFPVVRPSDRDDSHWHPLQGSGLVEASLGDGFLMHLSWDGTLRAGEAATLRGLVHDSNGKQVVLEPYLRMLGHAVIFREDGSVYSHLHPSGNLSMAAARRFGEKIDGAAGAQLMDVICGDLESLSPGSRNDLLRGSRVQFPYVFPEPGRYWFWVQVRIQGGVRTACFQLQVETARPR